jgi:hypothetical protein
LGISVSFSRDEENGGAIEREAMANGNNMIANEGDILDATAGQISIDPLLQALQTHSPPFLGFRLALDEYNDPILESTPNTRRQLRRASSISAGANFSDVMHDLRGLPTQNTIPVTLDLNQPLAIDEHEKMNVVLAQQQHFLLNSPVQNEDAVMAFTTSDERKAKKAKATPAKATKTMKIPPVPKIRVPHSSSSASAKSTKKPAPPKKTKSKDKDSERLDTISAILQDAKTKDSKKGPNYLTIDDLLYFLESIDPTLGADYRKRSAKRQSGQPKRADLLKVAVQLNMKTARTSFQRNNRVA